ncbi:alpha/beta hydrolase [Virgisporangium ochraceum]|uniref:Putative hydrolase, alpha/beta fold LipV n=1 Tax=Virgisporangium ochraceum TaxID=65505 RepID=A0A8J3ZSN5_9ACTN|nr:putative hydrolase, alpha/beta fold LipV [Virgisporangium ochraceum]
MHQFGDPAAPPLVALHGVQGHGGRFAPLATALGRRVHAPDLAGHGLSPWDPPWTMERYVDDVLTVLADLPPVDLAGHSFGGALAVWTARRDPSRVRSLLLIDPAMGISPEAAGRGADDAVTQPSFATLEEASAWLAAMWPAVPDGVRAAEIDQHLARGDDRRYRFRFRPAAAATVYSELSRESVTPPPSVPTLVLRAPRERVVRRHFLKLCAADGCDVTLVDIDCGHLMLEERPDEVLAEMRTFLSRVGAAPAE